MTALARRAYRGTAHAGRSRDAARVLRRRPSARAISRRGSRLALQRLLTDPKFIYRVEREPDDIAPDEAYRVSDLELASRLSFFIWSSIPDDELLTLAEQGKLGDENVLDAQVRRMLEDPRSAALTENFAGQWLNLRALEGHVPVAELFPDFDDNLRQAFRRETELLFDSLIRENRPVTELLDGGLHVRQRAAREALRNSRRVRQPFPSRDARRGVRRAARLARQGQPARGVVAADPNLARDPRLLGAAEPARRAAAAAAARRAGARGEGRRRGRQHARSPRCASRWSSIATTPLARVATC